MLDFSSHGRPANDEAGSRTTGNDAAARPSHSNSNGAGHFYDAHDFDDGLVHRHDWAVTSARR